MELRRLLAAAYGLPGAPEIVPLAGPGINNQVLEVRSAGRAFVLKRYQTHRSAETILYEHDLLAWLAAQGLPFAVPVALAATTGTTLLQEDGEYFALFARLPGTAVWPPTHGQLGEVGKALAHLHIVLADYPPDERPGLRGHGELAHVHPALPRPETLDSGRLGLVSSVALEVDLAWWRVEVKRIGQFAESIYSTLPWQVIHGDYTPSNTLFEGERLTAVLDFDLALPDARAMDVAAGLTFSMRVEEAGDLWTRADAFCRGYASVQRLTAAEIGALPELMALRDVVSTIWWLGRALAAGDVSGEIGRIVKTRQRAAWRIGNAARLVERCGKWLG